jgi:hypothetical protein
VNFEDEPRTFDEAWNYKDPKIVRSGEGQLKRSLLIWKEETYGMLSVKKMYLAIGDASNANGFLKSSEMESLELG